MDGEKEMFSKAEQVGRKVQDIESAIVRLIIERDTTEAKKKAVAEGWKGELARIDEEVATLKDQRAMLLVGGGK